MKPDSTVADTGSPPPAWGHRPRVRVMSRRQIDSVLFRNSVARIAFHSGLRLELRPLHYVYAAGCLFARSRFETTILSMLVKPEVVLEVDEVEGLYDWRSVIVRGKVTPLRSHGTADARKAYHAAVAALRTLTPAALTEHDPTPDRNAIIRIDPQEMTGREARETSRFPARDFLGTL